MNASSPASSLTISMTTIAIVQPVPDGPDR
jgi:hypothetical protein